jgi:hypothetical protein
VKTIAVSVTTTPKPSEGTIASYLYVSCHHTAALSPSAIILLRYTHPEEREKNSVGRENEETKGDRSGEGDIYFFFKSSKRNYLGLPMLYMTYVAVFLVKHFYSAIVRTGNT